MKIKRKDMKRIVVFALAVLAFAGCRQKVEPDVLPGKLVIEPLITKATEVNFENGDKIGLTVSVEGADRKSVV